MAMIKFTVENQLIYSSNEHVQKAHGGDAAAHTAAVMATIKFTVENQLFYSSNKKVSRAKRA